MKNTIITFVLLISFSVFSQNKSEIAKITQSYHPMIVEQLLERIKFKQEVKNKEIEKFIANNPQVKKEYASNGIKYLLSDILNNEPIYTSTDNKLSAFASKTNKLYPGGTLGLNLTGLGMTVGVWDGGWALATHQEFQLNGVSRVSNPDSPAINPTANDHATHVTGTVGAKGVVANARGMAYEVSLKSYNWDNDEFEASTEAASNALLISNHSYGIPIFNSNGTQNAPTWMMGCYNSSAYDWDDITYSLPYYLPVKSAGNNGSDSYSGGFADGYDKLTDNKNAKNILLVANANPTVHPLTGNLSSFVINPSSSQGPTDDGRIKPDIAADGTNLYSTVETSNSAYATYSGTSMASPSVAGSLILLQQHYNNLHSNFMKAATLKGLVCHTALDDATNVGPDPFFGYGLLDTSASATLITNDNNATPTAVIEELILTQSQTYTMQVAVTTAQTLKATISWTDLPGVAKDNQLNSPTPVLVNDLDIRIIKGSETKFPWKFDMANITTTPAIKGDNIVDNLEKVEVDNALGTYTIQITHKGTLSGGSQAYSLIISGFDQVVLGTKDHLQSKFNVYPNPTNDILNYEIPANYTVNSIEVYDISGKKINVIQGANQTINTANLQNGLYFVKFMVDGTKIIKKFIKQ